MGKLHVGTRWSLAVAGAMTVAAVTLSSCSPLDYGCHRQGSHGVVVCGKTRPVGQP